MLPGFLGSPPPTPPAATMGSFFHLCLFLSCSVFLVSLPPHSQPRFPPAVLLAPMSRLSLAHLPFLRMPFLVPAPSSLSCSLPCFGPSTPAVPLPPRQTPLRAQETFGGAPRVAGLPCPGVPALGEGRGKCSMRGTGGGEGREDGGTASRLGCTRCIWRTRPTYLCSITTTAAARGVCHWPLISVLSVLRDYPILIF